MFDFNMDITSANATAVMVVDAIFPAGIVLEMFSTDQAITQEQVDITDTRMGVDGYMVAGYMPNIVPVTIALEASSPSAKFFGQIWEYMQLTRNIAPCTLTVTLPSIRQIHTWTKGVMKSGQPLPGLSRVLAPTSWLFHFERRTSAGI